jgi:hypothetical protein
MTFCTDRASRYFSDLSEIAFENGSIEVDVVPMAITSRV